MTDRARPRSGRTKDGESRNRAPAPFGSVALRLRRCVRDHQPTCRPRPRSTASRARSWARRPGVREPRQAPQPQQRHPAPPRGARPVQSRIGREPRMPLPADAPRARDCLPPSQVGPEPRMQAKALRDVERSGHIEPPRADRGPPAHAEPTLPGPVIASHPHRSGPSLGCRRKRCVTSSGRATSSRPVPIGDRQRTPSRRSPGP